MKGIFSLTFGFALSVACGGGEPAPKIEAHNDLPDAAATPIAPPLRVLGMPHDAVIVGAFDPNAALSFRELRHEIESELSLPADALNGHLDALGIDGSHGITIAIANITDAQKKLVDELGPQARARTPIPDASALVKRLLEHSAMAFRFLIPASDSKKLVGFLGTFVEHEGFKASAKGYVRHREVLEIADGGDNVAVDYAIGESQAIARDTLHAAFDRAGDPPMALDGAALRFSYSPSAIANFGFLEMASRTAAALSGNSIDESQRQRILVEGLYEAGLALGLPAAEHIDGMVRTAPFEATLRATPSRFAVPAASPALVFDTAAMTVDSLHWPLATFSASTLRDTKFFGWFAGLPQLFASVGILAPRVSSIGPPDDVIAHFERTGESWTPSHEEVFVGVLPANTTRAAAECALAQKTPCEAKTKLTVDKVTKFGAAGTQSAKLLSIDKRFFVLLSSDAAALALKSHVVQAGPLHFEADTATATSVLKSSLTFPPHVSGTVATDHDATVFRLAP